MRTWAYRGEIVRVNCPELSARPRELSFTVVDRAEEVRAVTRE
jgi:hypothetical protein